MNSHRTAVLLSLVALAACSEPESPARPSAPVDLSVFEGSRSSRREIHLRGRAEPGATVRVFVAGCDGTPIAEGTAAQLQEPGLPLQAPENQSVILVALAAMPDGQLSPCSEPITFTHDGLAPEAPRLARFEPASPSSSLSAEAMLEGEPGAFVELFAEAGCGGSPLGVAELDAAGAARFPFEPAANRALDVHARALDAVLNVSPCVALGTFVHDGLAPARPAVASVTPAISRTTAQPVVAGTTEPGARLHFHLERECTTPVATGLADDAGAFAVPVPTPRNRSSTFFVSATDAAGNRSPCSNGGAFFTHDDVAPVRPALTSTPASPSNSVTTPAITGTAEKQTAISVFETADCSGPATSSLTADAAGAFGFTLTAAANTRSVRSVSSTDAAGNVSPCSLPLHYEHDDIPPAAPVLTGTDPVSPSNSVFDPQILGTAEPGAIVALSTSASCASLLGTGAADAAGNFAVKRNVTANSARQFWAVATDAAGNRSDCSTTSVSYLYDTRAPSAPVLLSTLPPSPSTTLAASIAGHAELGSTVELFATACTGAPLVSGPVGTTAWDLSGNALFELSATGNPGATTEWWARATDKAGNVSACSATPIAFTHAASGWGAARAPAGGLSGDGQPALALAGDGSAFAVWTRDIGQSEWRTFASRYTAALGWSPPVQLSTKRSLFDPSVAADAQGRAVAAWRESTTGNDYDIVVAAYAPATGWSTPTVLATGSTSYPVRVAMADDGTALAVWDLWTSARTISDAWSARYTPAGGWEAPVLLDSNAGYTMDARIWMEPGGHAVALFRSATGAAVSETLYAAIYSPATGWGPAERVTSNADERTYEAGIDASGVATVLFLLPGGSGSGNVQAARSSTGYLQHTALTSSNKANMNLRLAVEPGGSAIAAWVENGVLYTASHATATGWAAPTAAATSGFTNIGLKYVAGEAILTWQYDSPLWFRRLTAQGWQPAQLLTNHRVQQHAIGASGSRIVAVWSEGATAGFGATSLGARFFE